MQLKPVKQCFNENQIRQDNKLIDDEKEGDKEGTPGAAENSKLQECDELNQREIRSSPLVEEAGDEPVEESAHQELHDESSVNHEDDCAEVIIDKR